MACAQGEVCVNGKCELFCGGGLTKCSGKCVDTQSNPLHCGGCDKACGGAAKCVSGVCTPLKSCLDILNAGLSKGDGVYVIDANGGDPSDAFDVYCDMATNGGGWTLVMNIAPADGNSVGYNNQAFWTGDAPYGSFGNRFANDYKGPAAYTVVGSHVLIQSAGTGPNGAILGWRRWPLAFPRTVDSFFSTGIVSVHGVDACETNSPDAADVGQTSSWDDIIRQGSCLHADVNPSGSGEADLIRLTTIPANNTDNNMSGFASCIDCGAPWQGGSPYMGLDRAGCNMGVCAYSQICRVPSADCVGNYCSGTYSSSSCGSAWNSRIYVR
ncbi:MAG: hypothetical protein HY744_12395 [Deltaproteobacteria bacterium]|nr:hypothetical protein [Deltaproteobacteria bacterium]